MTDTQIQRNGADEKTAADRKLSTVRALIEQARPKFAEVATKHLTPERLARVAVAAIAKDGKILGCTPHSLLQAIMDAARLGLEPGSALGEAYLVPFKSTCQLIIGYRGLITLARRSGQIDTIEAHIWRQNDRFKLVFGLSTVLEHEPCLVGDAGPMLGAYAVARLKDGGYQVEVMTKDQVDAIRKRSAASAEGPWVTDYDEMARKTVVRRLCKYLPLSIEAAEAIERDDEAEGMNVIDLPPSAEIATKTAAIKARVKAKIEASEPDGGEFPTDEEIEAEEASREAARAVPPTDPPPASSTPPASAGGSVSSGPTEEKAAAKQLVQEAVAAPDPKKTAGQLLTQLDEAKTLSELAKLNAENEKLPEPYRSENLKAADEKRAALINAKRGK